MENKGKLKIKGNRLGIKGTMTYEISPSGQLSLEGFIKSKLIMGTKNLHRTYHIDPILLLSTQYQEPGKIIHIGHIQLNVKYFDPEKQIAITKICHPNGVADMTISTRKYLMDICQIRISISWKKLAIDLEISP